jgi:hypothetical protein
MKWWYIWRRLEGVWCTAIDEFTAQNHQLPEAKSGKTIPLVRMRFAACSSIGGWSTADRFPLRAAGGAEHCVRDSNCNVQYVNLSEFIT